MSLGHRAPRRSASMIACLVALLTVPGSARAGDAYTRPEHTELASVASNGSQPRDVPSDDSQVGNSARTSCGRLWNHNFDISADGRYVAFVSLAPNLVANDFNG